MTVAELKQVINTFPDNANIYVKSPTGRTVHTVYGIDEDIINSDTRGFVKEVVIFSMRNSEGHTNARR